MLNVPARLKALLAVPAVYQVFQSLVGAQRYYQVCYSGLVQAQPGERVLDIGCGIATGFAYLPPSIDYTGIDISPEYISSARKRYRDRGRFICADLRTLDAAGLAPFDRAIASGLLHHLDDASAHAVFRLVRTVVRPGGWLITMDPCYTPHQTWLARLFLDRDRGRYVRNLDGYRAIAGPYGKLESFTATKLIRIPTYASAIMRVHLKDSV